MSPGQQDPQATERAYQEDWFWTNQDLLAKKEINETPL